MPAMAWALPRRQGRAGAGKIEKHKTGGLLNNCRSNQTSNQSTYLNLSIFAAAAAAAGAPPRRRPAEAPAAKIV